MKTIENQFIRAFTAEIKKTKNTSALWLTIWSAAFIPFVMCIAYLFKPNFYLSLKKSLPWENLLYSLHNLVPLIFVLYTVLAVSLVVQIEFKANAWKQLFVQPLSLLSLYTAKLSTIFLLLLFFYLLFGVFYTITGLTIGIAKPDLLLVHQLPNLKLFLSIVAHSFVSVMGLVSLQYTLSLAFENFILPIAIGVIALMSIFFVGNSPSINYIPHLSPWRSYQQLRSSTELLFNNELNSIFVFLICGAVGYLLFKKSLK